ncbi:MAG: hypothetical protein PHU93_01400 [Candidatus Gracilibacteria bacterium]|nr:hypothetical protein [Candidatus Gracilibacteria bacterium]
MKSTPGTSNSESKTICIFGGAFNPPQLAHVGTMLELLDHPATERIIILPSGNRADKSFGIEAVHRVGMIQAMVDHLIQIKGDRVSVDWYFLEHPEIETTTRNEYAHVRSKCGERVSHVFGSDVLEAMTTWWDLDAGVGESTLFVAQEVPKTIVIRAGYEIIPESVQAKLANVQNIITLQHPSEISSTQIRNPATTIEELYKLVPETVAQYIIQNRLYHFL